MTDRRLAVAEAVEQATSRAVTETLFADGGDVYERAEASVLADLVAVRSRRGEAPAARERLERADRLVREVATTTSGDVPGLLAPVSPPGWVRETIRRRQAPVRAFLDAVTTAELVAGRLPFIPELPPPEPGGEQAGGEKTELPSRVLVVEGSQQPPTLVGQASNVSWQAMTAGGDVLLALVGEAALLAAAEFVADALVDAAGPPVGDLAEALAQIEANGWAPSLIVGPASLVVGLDPTAATAAGLTVLAGAPVGARLVVLALAGLWCAVSDQVWQTREPSIAGHEIGSWFDCVVRPAPGSVAVVE